MSDEEPTAPPNITAELLNRLDENSVKKISVVIASMFIPGLGSAVYGQWKRGLIIFIAFAIAIALSYVSDPMFLDDYSISSVLIHCLICIVAIVIWVANIVQCIVSYELNLEKFLSKYLQPQYAVFTKFLEKITSPIEKKKEEKEWTEKDYLDFMLNDPRRAIVGMSLIVSLTFIATKVNSFLDKVWISNISMDAMAAVSTVSNIYSVVAAIGVGIGTGACVCISYTLGKKSFERSQELSTASIFLSILISIPTAIFLIVAVGPITEVQGEAISELSMNYIIPLALGCPFIILSGVIGSLFKAEGAMKVMTFCAIISVPVNAVLTPIFINQFGWGISGASLATVIGSAVSTALSIYMFKRGNYHFKLKLAIPTSASIKEILSVGGPKTLEEALGGIIILMQTLIITVKTGNLTLALIGIAFSFPYLMTMLPDSITAGSTPVCSVQAGAHNVEKMKDSIKYTIMLTLVLSVIAAIVLAIFAGPIDSLFIGDKEVEDEELLLNVTRMYAILVPFYLLGRACSNMLQVVRKSHISAPVYIGIGFLRLGVLYLFADTTMDVALVDIGMNVLLGIVMLLLLFYYTKNFDPDKVDSKEDKWFSRMDNIRKMLDRHAEPENETA